MELVHANRLATMGQLAASIAHEVNQPISAVVTNAQTALRWLRTQSPELGEVTYACACDKFFPVVTPYRTKKGETLIVTVMAKPCTMKK